MSNLTTLPKGDSAWLLRKAIERLMQQVSVLETNIGASTSGNSANTQVIFNDNGTLRGDAGLTYNASTDALTIGGLLSAGSATITGDLTVDTSTLKVDSANNRVGIGTASPAVGNLLHVSGTVAVPLLLERSGSNDVYLSFKDNSGLFGYLGFSNGDFLLQTPTGGYSTKLRLDNAGNLGLGVTPSAWGSPFKAIDISSGGSIAGSSTSVRIFSNAYYNGSNYIYKNNAGAARYDVIDNTHVWYYAAGGSAGNAITFTQAMTLDASGRLGVGVTPVNRLTIGSGTFNADTLSGSASLYSTVSQGLVILADGLAVATRGGVNRIIADTSGNIISNLTTTAPTLSDNGYMVFNLTSNTNLRITVRCNDGTTRTANITLA